MKKCDKFGCVANLNGECVNNECRGELIQRPPCRISDKEKRKEWYNIHADTFRRDFPETDIKAQMRQDGICEDDIELAVSAIDELKKGGGRMAEYIEREKVYNILNGLLNDICDSTETSEEFDVGWETALERANDKINDIPAADVRPERHGEWLVSGECYECSECGGGSTVNTNPYCWKCGAKMDGKDGDSG